MRRDRRLFHTGWHGRGRLIENDGVLHVLLVLHQPPVFALAKPGHSAREVGLVALDPPQRVFNTLLLLLLLLLLLMLLLLLSLMLLLLYNGNSSSNSVNDH